LRPAPSSRHRGLSADHLELHRVDDSRDSQRARWHLLLGTPLPADTIAVDLFRTLGVPMALATNSNPVSSPTVSPASQMHLACYLFRLTPEEALRGFTVNSARALGLSDTAGQIAVGRAADLAIWDTDDPRGIAYAIGGTPCLAVIKDGSSRTRRRRRCWRAHAHATSRCIG
jgi:imidazolonepropionase